MFFFLSLPNNVFNFISNATVKKAKVRKSFAFPSCRRAMRAAFKNRQRGAILTTHYMEEAEAVCDRVAIMVSGQLRFAPQLLSR